MINMKKLNRFIAVASITGVLLSAYAYQVELSIEKDNNHSAFCEISPRINCTKVFTSEYGRGFGIVGKLIGEDSYLNIQNSVFAIIHYTILGLLCLSSNPVIIVIQFSLAILTVISSFGLAYVLFIILNDFCLVCVSTYIVNAIIFVLTYKKVKSINGVKKGIGKKTKKDKKKSKKID